MKRMGFFSLAQILLPELRRGILLKALGGTARKFVTVCSTADNTQRFGGGKKYATNIGHGKGTQRPYSPPTLRPAKEIILKYDEVCLTEVSRGGGCGVIPGPQLCAEGRAGAGWRWPGGRGDAETPERAAAEATTALPGRVGGGGGNTRGDSGPRRGRRQEPGCSCGLQAHPSGAPARSPPQNRGAGARLQPSDDTLPCVFR